MKRREFLSTATLAGLAGTLPLERAAAAGHGKTIPIVQSRQIGQLRVTAISDGFLPIDAATMVGVEGDVFSAALEKAHIAGDVHPTGVNAYLVEAGDERILIDAGTGTAFGPGLGHLAGHLTELGAPPESITKVIATHLHPDHIGGLFADGQNAFVNAGLVTSKDDMDFWSDEDIKAQVPDSAKSFFDLAMGTVGSFGDRVETVSGEADLGNGMTAIPLPGHTPGHMGIMLESDGAQLMIWGDIIHVGPLQFADPSVSIVFDVDRDTAFATRKTMLDRAVADGLLIAGSHIDFPGMGYVSKSGTGYRWEPAPYPYG